MEVRPADVGREGIPGRRDCKCKDKEVCRSVLPSAAELDTQLDR